MVRNLFPDYNIYQITQTLLRLSFLPVNGGYPKKVYHMWIKWELLEWA